MKGKNFFVAGIIVVAMFIAGTSVGIASDQDICKEQIKHYQLMKMNDGLLPGDEFNPYDYKGVEAAAKSALENEGKREHNDKNHEAISKLVATHLEHIVTAAGAAKEGAVESVGHSMRFLYLSCKACHKVYRTEMRLRP